MIEQAAITLTSPEGGAWEFLVLFLVVIVGPPLVQRAGVPGLIGLLLGGFLIGPNGLGLLDEGSTTIPDLGQLGLLYLMFVAGVELDLALLRKHRRSAIVFGALTFGLPMALGTTAGFALGWSAPAALLLGSLLASYTLVLYPLARSAGISNDPLIASTVGATVLTDTVALVILAVISGTQTGSGGSSEVGLQITLGLFALGAFAFVIVPRVARIAFRLLGTERTVRYVIAVAAFLSAAVVAEVFGIEGIVGAFFAGLAMNRLVPSEGPLMNRIDFFGTAVFVPVFLVSVGLLLKPSVMFTGETLGIAAVIIAACIGGKLAAALLTRPLLKASWPQVWMVFALSTPQAAATLASTTVGFEIGLFSEAVVNAVLVLILVSIIVSTLVAEREKQKVEPSPSDHASPGERVVVTVTDAGGAPLALRIADAVAAKVGGVVDVVLLVAPSTDPERRSEQLEALGEECRSLAIDADPQLRVSEEHTQAAVLAGYEREASLVLFAEGMKTSDAADWAEALPASVPLGIVRGAATVPLDRAVLIRDDPPRGRNGLASHLLEILGPETAEVKTAAAEHDDAPEDQLAVVPVEGLVALSSLRPSSRRSLLIVPDEATGAGIPADAGTPA